MKSRGETPLQLIDRLRIEKPELKSERLSYAGRLDPMATGLMLILVGSECDIESRPFFLNMDKEYVVEILLGINTDTYDVLGIVKDVNKALNTSNPDDLLEKVKNELKKFIGTEHGLTYPPFSSKTIDGKSMFSLALKGELKDEDLIKSKGEIYNIEILDSYRVSSRDLLTNVVSGIQTVNGTFRQDEITERWKNILESDDFIRQKWPVFKILVCCQSGVYMRSLANELGSRLGCGALAYSIHRTKIGNYTETETA
jgi:tRNA pseudouridine55 synthase